MALPDPTLWLGIDPSKADEWEDFMAQNSQWHDAIYQSAQVNGLPLYTKKPNWYGPGGMQDWLAAQQQEHQSIANTYQMGSTGDLYDVDPKNKESMKLWMAAHAMEHVAILQAGTGLVTAQYSVSYNYAYGWLDTLSINSGTATLDPTPFYRYPSNPKPSWGTYPATLGDGATWPFEDGNMDGWVASGSGVSVQANTNAANAYSGEGSLQINLSLGAGQSASVAYQFSAPQQLGSSNLYAMILLPASSHLDYNLWFQDSSGNRAFSIAYSGGSAAGWYNGQYQNGDNGQNVPSGMNWNSIEYVGLQFSALGAPPGQITSAQSFDYGSVAGPSTFTENYSINEDLSGATLSGSVNVLVGLNVPNYSLSSYMTATDSNGNKISGAAGVNSGSGQAGDQIQISVSFSLDMTTSSFDPSSVVSLSVVISVGNSGNTLQSGTISAITQSGGGGTPFTGTVFLDHVNIGGSGQVPAPLYGWGVSIPSTIPLRPLESVTSSTVNFSSSFPSGTYGGVYARVSTDNGTTWGGWNQCTSGQPLPGLPTGINGQQLAFQFNVTLYGSSTNSPSVGTVSVTVNTELTFLAPLN